MWNLFLSEWSSASYLDKSGAISSYIMDQKSYRTPKGGSFYLQNAVDLCTKAHTDNILCIYSTAAFIDWKLLEVQQIKQVCISKIFSDSQAGSQCSFNTVVPRLNGCFNDSSCDEEESFCMFSLWYSDTSLTCLSVGNIFLIHVSFTASS